MAVPDGTAQLRADTEKKRRAGSFDPPTDMIDGYLNVGFYVTDDPSVPGSYFVGTTSYSDPAVTIPAVGVWGRTTPSSAIRPAAR